MTEVRDWQKDMELGHTARYENAPIYLNPVLDAYFYWMSEAATEKERADKAEQRARVTDAMEATARAAGAALIEAEAREKKLREAIKEAIDTWESLDDFDDPLDAVERMIAILQPFYPDKEKPQIKPLNNEDMQASQAFINRAMKEEEAK